MHCFIIQTEEINNINTNTLTCTLQITKFKISVLNEMALISSLLSLGCVELLSFLSVAIRHNIMHISLFHQ